MENPSGTVFPFPQYVKYDDKDVNDFWRQTKETKEDEFEYRGIGIRELSCFQ